MYVLKEYLDKSRIFVLFVRTRYKHAPRGLFRFCATWRQEMQMREIGNKTDVCVCVCVCVVHRCVRQKTSEDAVYSRVNKCLLIYSRGESCGNFARSTNARTRVLYRDLADG